MWGMWKFERAKKIIVERGRTREWVARQSRISVRTLHECLAGRRSPSPAVIALMALALECDESELTSESAETPDKEPEEAAG